VQDTFTGQDISHGIFLSLIYTGFNVSMIVHFSVAQGCAVAGVTEVGDTVAR